MRLSCSGIRPAQSADFTSTIYVSMILPSIPGRTNPITEDMENTILLHSPEIQTCPDKIRHNSWICNSAKSMFPSVYGIFRFAHYDYLTPSVSR